MKIKLIPSIEAEFADLKEEIKTWLTLLTFLSIFSSVFFLLRELSLRTAIYCFVYCFLIFLPLICLWAIYIIIGAKISISRRTAITEQGDRVMGVIRKEVWRRGKNEAKIGVRWVIEYQDFGPKTWKSPVYPMDLAFVFEPECKCVLYVRGRSVCLAEDQPDEWIRKRLLKAAKGFHLEEDRERLQKTAQAYGISPSRLWQDDFERIAKMLGVEEEKRQIQEGSASEIKYSIETFPRLSETEAAEMDEEWDLTYNIITDSFFRFFSLLFWTYTRKEFSTALYNVYVEIRYENSRPNGDKLLLMEEKLDEKLNDLGQECRAKRKGQIDYKSLIRTELQKEVRALLAQHMPDLVITDVFVEALEEDLDKI